VACVGGKLADFNANHFGCFTPAVGNRRSENNIDVGFDGQPAVI